MMREEIIKLVSDCARDSGVDLLRGRDPSVYVEKILKHAEILAWHQGGNLRAIVAFYANDSEVETSFITLLAVSPGQQGKGVASSLLKSCFSIMSTRGFKRCRLEVALSNQRAVRFYVSLGFIEVARDERTIILEMDIGAAISMVWEYT